MEKVYTNLTNGGPVSVYVKDGVITRIRPLQIPETDFPKPWVIVGNDGKKYSLQRRSALPRRYMANVTRFTPKTAFFTP